MSNAIAETTWSQTRPRNEADQTPASPKRHELTALLNRGLPDARIRQVRQLLADPLFRRREGLTDREASELAYARARFVARTLHLEGIELREDPTMLYVLHEWLPLSDGACATILSIHYCLALGSLIEHGQGNEAVAPFVNELERMDSVGVFLATELGYGNNVASLETRAVYRPETRDFLLTCPSPQAVKFMPNTAVAVPKVGIVMARLVSLGRDCGVFPFIVRIRDKDGAPCQGIRIAPLTEKAAYALDNGITLLRDVVVPRHHLLTGLESTLHDDGRFESRIASPRQRFLSAMGRVQAGRVCFTSAAVATLRAATWIAMRYSVQRLASAPGLRTIPIYRYRNVQTDLFGALASAYALTFAVRAIQQRYKRRAAESDNDTFRWVATLKAVATAEANDALLRLRERCGAVGMLTANRLVEFLNQVQGVITAEGDNQLMLLKCGRQLWDECPAPYERTPAMLSDISTCTARELLELFRTREARTLLALRRSVRASLQTTRNSFSVWNQNVNVTIAAATAHGLRIVAESFFHALGETRNPQAAHWLGRLFLLWGIGHLERNAGWYLVWGCLTKDCAARLPQAKDQLCAELEPHAMVLADAFDFDNTELQAPIADDDYVKRYYALLGES